MKKNTYLKLYIQGGLGNQIFQVAAGNYLASKLGRKLIVSKKFQNVSGILRMESISQITNIDEDEIEASSVYQLIFRILRKMATKNRLFQKLILTITGNYFSREVGYDPNLEKISPNAFTGYFQTCRYQEYLPIIVPFAGYGDREQIRIFERIMDEIELKNPVGMHIRRGDYSNEVSGIGLLSLSYFDHLIQTVVSSERECWIISDSPSELEPLISSSNSRIRILTELNQMPAAASIELLSKFDELIISNSSFSLAAALRSATEKRVHYPEPWFRNLPQPQLDFPAGWVSHKSSWQE